MRLRSPIIVPILAAGIIAAATWVASVAEVERPYGMPGIEYRPSAAPLRQVPIPAFPGCEGHGCTALTENQDCRALPVDIHTVTNTNGTGDGSLVAVINDSLSDSELDVVLFSTGGTITNGTSNAANLLRDCVIVAGQTAPGGGFGFKNDSTENGGLIDIGDGNSNDPANDVIWAYLNHWKSAHDGTDSQQGNFAVYNGEGVVITNVSVVGAEDQAFDFISGRGGFMDGVTLTNSLVTPAWTSGLAGFMQVGIATTSGKIRNVDWHRNYYPFPVYRCPAKFGRSTSREYQDTIHTATVSQTICYGWASRVMLLDVMVDTLAVIESTFKHHVDAPDTNASQNDDIVEIDEGLEARIDTVDWGAKFQNNAGTAGQCSHDLWPECFQVASNGALIGADSVGRVRPNLPPAPTFPYTGNRASSVTQIFTDFNVGNYQGVDCSGDWFRRQNRMDSLYLVDGRDSTLVMQPVENETVNTEMFPALAAGTACTDQDSDGLPDDFEFRYSTEGDSSSLAPDSLLASGRLMVEAYIWALDPFASDFSPTYYPNTDSSLNVYRLRLFTDTFVFNGGLDTAIFRRPATDTLPNGTIFDLHPDCIAGDTLGLLTTSDTLSPGGTDLAPIDSGAVTTFGTTHNLPGCDSETVEARKVHGVASLDATVRHLASRAWAWRRRVF